MIVSNCPYCDIQIHEDYNFCVSCERQVKCLGCGSYLIKDKSRCLKCGILLIIDIDQSASNPMNKFSLEEEQSDNNYSRKINLSFTDSAIDKVSSVLSGYAPLTLPKSSRQVTQPQQQLNLPFVSPQSDQSNCSETNNKETVEITAKVSSDDNDAYNYFDKDSKGFLVSANPNYKGSNKKQQQQRFSLLYVWAYYAIYEEPVPSKEHLSQAAKLNGVHDQNYSQHLNDVANRYFIKSDGTFKLNPNGKVHLKEIQTEMGDLELKGFDYSISTRKKSNRGSRTTTTKEDLQKVEQWVQMPSRFSDFDVRKLNNAYQVAILALYDITKELKVENAVKSSLAYEYINKRYKTIPTSWKNFNDTLSRSLYEKYFEHTHEGFYYLTRESESLAESWINE